MVCTENTAKGMVVDAYFDKFMQLARTKGVSKIMADNIVFTVIIISLLIWVPVAYIFHAADMKQEEIRKKKDIAYAGLATFAMMHPFGLINHKDEDGGDGSGFPYNQDEHYPYNQYYIDNDFDQDHDQEHDIQPSDLEDEEYQYTKPPSETGEVKPSVEERSQIHINSFPNANNLGLQTQYTTQTESTSGPNLTNASRIDSSINMVQNPEFQFHSPTTLENTTCSFNEKDVIEREMVPVVYRPTKEELEREEGLEEASNHESNTSSLPRASASANDNDGDNSGDEETAPNESADVVVELTQPHAAGRRSNLRAKNLQVSLCQSEAPGDESVDLGEEHDLPNPESVYDMLDPGDKSHLKRRKQWEEKTETSKKIKILILIMLSVQ